MAVVKNIDVAVRANTQQFETGMKRVVASVNRMDSLLGNIGMNIPFVDRLTTSIQGLGPIGAAAAAGLVTLGAGAFAAYRGLRAVWDIMTPVRESLDVTAKAAERLGITTAELQRLQHAASLADVSSESLITSMQKMSRTISDAASGNKANIQTFLQLQLSVQALARMSPDKAFRAIAEAISRVSSPMDRLRLTMEVFGRGGAPLVNLLQGGARAMAEAGKEADKLRLTINELDAKNVQELNDNLTRLTSAFIGLATVLTRHVSPILTEVIADMTSAIVEPLAKLEAVAARWRDIGTAIVTSGGPLNGLRALSQLYFDEVQKGAVETQNAFNKSSQNRQGGLTPAQIEAGIERQEQMQKLMAERRAEFERRHAAMVAHTRAMALRAIEEERASRARAFEEAMDARDRYRKSLMEAGERVRESVATPFEQFVNRIAELRSLLARRAISGETFGRAFAAAREEFGKSMEETAADVFRDTPRPAAVEAGTQEAFAAFQSARDAAKTEDKILEEARKHTRSLDSLVRRGIILAAARGL